MSPPCPQQLNVGSWKCYISVLLLRCVPSPFGISLFWDTVALSFSNWSWTHSKSQAGRELVMLLPQSPMYLGLQAFITMLRFPCFSFPEQLIPHSQTQAHVLTLFEQRWRGLLFLWVLLLCGLIIHSDYGVEWDWVHWPHPHLGEVCVITPVWERSACGFLMQPLCLKTQRLVSPEFIWPWFYMMTLVDEWQGNPMKRVPRGGGKISQCFTRLWMRQCGTMWGAHGSHDFQDLATPVNSG